MFGRGYASFCVQSLSLRKLMQYLTRPSFFLTRTGGQAHAEDEGSITPMCKISSRWVFSSFSKLDGVRLIFCFTGRAIPVSMECVTVSKAPRSKLSLEKTSWYSTRTLARISVWESLRCLLDLSHRSLKCSGTAVICLIALPRGSSTPITLYSGLFIKIVITT